jgi:hypothetical protein
LAAGFRQQFHRRRCQIKQTLVGTSSSSSSSRRHYPQLSWQLLAGFLGGSGLLLSAMLLLAAGAFTKRLLGVVDAFGGCCFAQVAMGSAVSSRRIRKVVFYVRP